MAMTKEQFGLLIQYIDQAIDARIEYMEPGADGYHGNSGREERRRRELETDLWQAFQSSAPPVKADGQKL